MMTGNVTIARGAAVLFMAYQAVAMAGPPVDRSAGGEIYANTCAACHQPNGMGMPETFPPLAGHAAAIVSGPGGRDFLARLVLFGMEGTVAVDGKTFTGAMPPLGEILTDAQLANALDYVLHAWDNDKVLPPGFQPIQPAELAAARSAPITAAEVYALRGRTLGEAEVASAADPVSFTDEQASRGRAAYRRACQDCHGNDLGNGEFGGAPLNGQYFVRHWGNGPVAALYGYLLAKMPPDRPGKLNPQTYADLVAFLLSKNGYPAGGAELPADADQQRSMTLKR